MICHNCGTEIPDGLKVCPKCGSNTGVEQQRFCTKCGAPLRPNDSFCTACGSYTGVEQQQFCTKCGAPLKPNDSFCTACGSYTQKKREEIETNHASAAGYAALGFVFPIIGFILAATMSKNNPNGAKIVLGASLVGFLIEVGVFLPNIFYYL